MKCKDCGRETDNENRLCDRCSIGEDLLRGEKTTVLEILVNHLPREILNAVIAEVRMNIPIRELSPEEYWLYKALAKEQLKDVFVKR